MKQSSLSQLALTGFVLAILAGLVAMLAGFGSRWGWLNFRIGFIILRWAGRLWMRIEQRAALRQRIQHSGSVSEMTSSSELGLLTMGAVLTFDLSYGWGEAISAPMSNEFEGI
jgi:hypothetical protein